MKPRLSWETPASHTQQEQAGLRFGSRGTHTSRTLMLAELSELLATVPRNATRTDYRDAIVGENALGKETASNRRLTDQRLGELYALDPRVPIFRVLLRLWDVDESGRPLLALLCALGRDPLLRATTAAVVPLAPGQELLRTSMSEAIRQETEDRLNLAIADKVARNAASSWAQSGHLEGRVRKIRRAVRATPGSVVFALWLGSLQELAGENLLASAWVQMLDAGPSELLDLVLRAKQLGLVRARIGGGVTEIDPRGLDPLARWE
jgi:hypothetical protein